MHSAKLMLFTDGSVDRKSGIGYGTYLLTSDLSISMAELSKRLITRRFDQTSSTKLELQTLLWALEDERITSKQSGLSIFTDSQNIMGLTARRERLENNNYYSNKHKRLNNYQLYQTFFSLNDHLRFRVTKVAGHKTAANKDKIDEVFTLVDRASRSALREFMLSSTESRGSL